MQTTCNFQRQKVKGSNTMAAKRGSKKASKKRSKAKGPALKSGFPKALFKKNLAKMVRIAKKENIPIK